MWETEDRRLTNISRIFKDHHQYDKPLNQKALDKDIAYNQELFSQL